MTKYIHEFDSSFYVYLQTLEDFDTTINRLSAEFEDLSIDWRGFTETDQNWITFKRNPYYAPLRLDDEDGWLNYRYQMSFTAKPTVDVDDQDELAARIVEGLTKLNYRFYFVGKD